ncbi:MAG: DUF4352 domain-containing protein [Bacilli bacterium]|nr:DUF4352 domain-containing protein [Bacilli bacterium]
MKKLIILFGILFLLTGCEEKYTTKLEILETNTKVEYNNEEYVVLKLKVTNESDKKISYGFKDFCIYDSNDKQLACTNLIENDQSFLIAESKFRDNLLKGKDSYSLDPGESMEGYVGWKTNATDIKKAKIIENM